MTGWGRGFSFELTNKLLTPSRCYVPEIHGQALDPRDVCKC